MPPRFPGMDPWLESRTLWPDLHASLIANFRELLTPQLRPRYFAGIEQRVYVVKEGEVDWPVVVPDVVVRSAEPRGVRPATALVATPATIVIDLPFEVTVREGRIVIQTPDGSSLIAVIELLSPSNKIVGSRGFEEYNRKRNDVMESQAHLIEIDLLRSGTRVVGTSHRVPPGDYYVQVSRAPKRPRREIWAWTVRDAAPVIPIPLKDGEPDALLDIGAAIRLAYERGGYDTVIDYGKAPDPPLSPEDATWARARE